ncbi:MAG TPA: hypothetical protein VMK84_09340 [Streptosporangiaceae bacterium]|nr:hypothetical protein [Streptosporangiaceae bacterium]
MVDDHQAAAGADPFRGVTPRKGACTVNMHVHRLRRDLDPRYGRNLVTARNVGLDFRSLTGGSG